MNPRSTKFILFCSSFLLVFLPITNLFLQFATKVLGWTEYVALFKDGVFVLLIITCGFEIWRLIAGSGLSLVSNKTVNIANSWTVFKIFLPILIAVILNLIPVISSFIFNDIPVRSFVFGYYFELWWLDIAAVFWTWIFVKQEFDPEFDLFRTSFWKMLNRSLELGFIIPFVVTLLSFIFGQDVILSIFGYGREIVGSNLVSTTTLCHVVDYGLESCRASGSFTHPVHFAGYLLLILPFFVVSRKWWLVGANLFCLFLTYSRYSWLGLFSIFCLVILWQIWQIRRRVFQKYLGNIKIRNLLVTSIILVPAIFGISAMSINPQTLSDFSNLNSNLTKYIPQSILKPSSTTEHYRRLGANLEALSNSSDKWLFGYGLSSSGSAARDKYSKLESNQFALRNNATTYRWTLLPQDLVISENWILSTILNGGFVYGFLYLVLASLPLLGIWQFLRKSVLKNSDWLLLVLSSGFWAVFVGNNLQLLWENQVLTGYWTILGSAVILGNKNWLTPHEE